MGRPKGWGATLRKPYPMTQRRVLPLYAFLSLLLGTTVYWFSRPEGSTLLQMHLDPTATFVNLPHLVSGSLPSLYHAFAFSLLSIGMLGFKHRDITLACTLWFALDTLFELGQHEIIAARLAELGLGHSYFQLDTFDPLDLLATVVGVTAAAFLARYTHV